MGIDWQWNPGNSSTYGGQPLEAGTQGLPLNPSLAQVRGAYGVNQMIGAYNYIFNTIRNQTSYAYKVPGDKFVLPWSSISVGYVDTEVAYFRGQMDAYNNTWGFAAAWTGYVSHAWNAYTESYNHSSSPSGARWGQLNTILGTAYRGVIEVTPSGGNYTLLPPIASTTLRIRVKNLNTGDPTPTGTVEIYTSNDKNAWGSLLQKVGEFYYNGAGYHDISLAISGPHFTCLKLVWVDEPEPPDVVADRRIGHIMASDTYNSLFYTFVG